MSFRPLPLHLILLTSAYFANAQKDKPWPDSTIHSILLPSDPPPEEPEDSYDCVFENVTQYYDVPKPTGVLLDALFDYGDELFEECVDRSGADYIASDLSDWQSTVSSWWSAHSSKAVSVAEECPQYWFEAGVEVLDGRSWLNKTIIFAGCDSGSKASSEATTTGAQITGDPTTGAAPASTQTQDRSAATSTTQLDEGAAVAYMRRGGGEDVWKVVGGMAAAMVNAML
ncbi:hypothetical protein LIA77_09115 [Sarocladium implicatum]|nr:hypothetical protein LIA77_09115 [Sarocladium implicatum]